MGMIQSGDLVLFLGDSVTDCGRSREDNAQNGNGYVHMIDAQFTEHFPQMKVKFVNRATSGFRVKDIKAGLQKDCLDLKPNMVTILIGINDTWRRYDSNDPTSAAAYRRDYRHVLTQIRDKLDAQLVLIDPFLIHVLPEHPTWRDDLNRRIDVVRELAQEFSAIYIPLDGILAAASTKVPGTIWCADGIHPTAAGHALIARTWLDAVLARA
jgi:acyl-CoA thioesterase I